MDYAPFFFSSGGSGPTTRLEALQRELEVERLRERILARKIAERIEGRIRLETELEMEMIRRLSAEGPPRPVLSSPPKHGIWRRPASVVPRCPLLVPHPSPPTTGYDYLVNDDEGIRAEEEEEEIVLAMPAEVATPSVPMADVGVGGKKRKFPEAEKRQWGCALCRVTAVSEEVLEAHLQGKKHLARAAEKFKSGSSGIGIGGGDLLKGKKTGAAKKKGKAAAAEVEDGKGWRKVSIQADGELHQVMQRGNCLRCEVCHVRSYSNSVMASHLSGKKHRDTVHKSSH